MHSLKHKSITAAMALLGVVVAISVRGDSGSLSISNASVTVAGSSSTILEFAISRSGDTSYDTFVQCQAQDGTAIAGAGTDYAAALEKIVIPVTVAGNAASQGIKLSRCYCPVARAQAGASCRASPHNRPLLQRNAEIEIGYAVINA